MPTRRTPVRQKLPRQEHPRLQSSRARSIHYNTDWSDRARAGTWYLSSCDPVTGGKGGFSPMTPMSKLFFPPAEAGASFLLYCIRGVLWLQLVPAPGASAWRI
jgi:hypothetical protein